MNPMVSIIVPVYNAEKSICRCIDSILNQEYTDFELLLMDDGSTDSSGSICDEYAKNDSRVKVIHKENSGVSDTRNQALDLARGKYLQFLDSDDWITPNATKLFVEAAEGNNCDLVIADFYRVIGERVSHKGDIEQEGVMTLEEYASHMIENPADFYYGVLWNKFFRRDIVEKYHLRMDASISWCEDFMFNLEYIRHSEIFYALQVPIYYYVKTKGSLVSQGMSVTKTLKTKLMVFEYYNNFYKHVLDEEDYEKNIRQVYRFLVDAANDGSVPPTLFPNSTKLGKERSMVSEEALAGEGFLMDAYRNRKLLDYYLEPVAIKNDLTLKDTRLLFYLSQSRGITKRPDFIDFSEMSPSSLNRSLQKLAAKDLLRVNTKRESDEFLFTFLPAVMPILEEFDSVIEDYEQARFQNLTEDEIHQYYALNEKIKQNIQKIL
ncbi:MAG: glycosyltransferase [Dorea sp.]